MKIAFKKGLKVKVLSGSDKGKVGIIAKLLLKKDMAVVQGVNVKTHFSKKDGILKQEAAINLCKLRAV